jgi:hypothetical protein
MTYQNGRIKKEGNHKYLVELENLFVGRVHIGILYFHHCPFLRLTILST